MNLGIFMKKFSRTLISYTNLFVSFSNIFMIFFA